MNRDSFSRCHPAVNFIYFVLVLSVGMFCMHPVTLAVSLGTGLLYARSLKGSAVGVSLRFLLPMAVMAAGINLLFNHEGSTVLTYLPTGSPVTLESTAYGMAAAAMLAGVILWFSCCSAVMTSDKIICLFGRVIPALSLILSMTLRFVPGFAARFRTVSQAQRCLGRDISSGPFLQRLKTAVLILSVLLTWSLENAVETADSMKSRGYGLPGRSCFSVYTFDARDRGLLVWLLLCGGYVLVGGLSGGIPWQYYPVIRGDLNGGYGLSIQLAYLALCLTPVILNRMEDRKWKQSRSET